MAKTLRVLILEDRTEYAELMIHELRKAGYAPDSSRVDTREKYLAGLDPMLDLILAEYTLPRFNALDALRLLRERSLDIPFIVVTESASEEAAVECMRCGADDYLLKDRLARLGPAAQRALEERALRVEKHRMDETLRQSELHYRELFHRIGNAVAVYEAVDGGQDFLFKDFNPAAERIEKVRKEDVVGHRVTEIFPGVRDMGMLDVFRGVWKTGESARYPAAFYRDWRHEGWRESFVYRLPSGEVVAVYDDVTERMQTENALRESEEKYRLLMEHAGIGIGYWSPQGRLLLLNEEGARHLNGSPRDFIGKHASEIFDASAAANIVERIAAVSGSDESREYMDRVELPMSGKWFLSTYRRLVDDQGVLTGVQILAHDISERKRAEEKLDGERNLLLTLINNLPDVVYIKDTESRFMIANRSIAEFMGARTPDALTGKTDRDFYPAEMAAKFRADEEEILRTGFPLVNREETATSHMGEKHWFLTTKVPMRDRSGNVTGLIGIGRNITKHKRAEEERREAREHLQQLFAASPLPVITINLQGKVRMWNRAAERVFGWTAEEVVGMPPPFVPPANLEQFHALLNRVLGGERLDDIEIRRRRKDGSPIDLLLNAAPIHDASGRMVGAMNVLVDISEHNRREKELREQSAAIENASEAIMITDANNAITYVNPAFQAITGYSRQDAMGKTGAILRSDAHDDASFQSLWEQVSSGRVWRGRITNRRKDGSLYQEEKTVAPILDGSGRFQGSVSIGRDVTQEVELENRLRESQKVEAIGQLAGGIAHDFNNMLQVIGGYLEVLFWKGSLQEESRQYLQEMRKAIVSASNLTQQLLAFSRRQLLELRPVDMNETVATLLKMIQRVIGEDIHLKFLPGTNLDLVTADTGQLEQALLNLCLNSRDAMPGGGILTIETEVVQIDEQYALSHNWTQPGRYVRVSVSDTGCGMDAETLARIFEPFFTTKEVGKGTGLGLPVVYGIVKQHRGMIHAYSEPGKGTIIRISLPAGEDSAVKETVKTVEEPVAGGTETILLAEDDESIRNLVVQTLEQAGYRVLAASDGQEAAELFEAHAAEVSLAVLDVAMPKLSGRDAYARMRARSPGLPALFCSGYSPNAGSARFPVEEGMALIQKPYNLKDLLRRIRQAVDKPRGATSARGSS